MITDCRGDVSYDSFSWQATLTLHRDGQDDLTFASPTGFQGPVSPQRGLPAQVVRAWKLALGRDPSASELLLANTFLSRQINYLNEHPDRLQKKQSAAEQALTNLCQSLLNANEFLYVE